jgi:hypothetical protein
VAAAGAAVRHIVTAATESGTLRIRRCIWPYLRTALVVLSHFYPISWSSQVDTLLRCQQQGQGECLGEAMAMVASLAVARGKSDVILLANTLVLREPIPGIVNPTDRGFRPHPFNQCARTGVRSTPPRALMPSTPFVYPQVASCLFASFRVVDFSVSAGQHYFLRRVRFPVAPPRIRWPEP